MDIPAILQHLRPGAAWSLNGDTYDGLVWHDDSPKPTEEELVAAWPAVQTARANAAAEAARAAAYKLVAEPLFFSWQEGGGSDQAGLCKRAEMRGRFPYEGV